MFFSFKSKLFKTVTKCFWQPFFVITSFYPINVVGLSSKRKKVNGVKIKTGDEAQVTVVGIFLNDVDQNPCDV